MILSFTFEEYRQNFMQSTTQLVDSIAKNLNEQLDISKQELEQNSNTIRDLRMKLESAKTAKSIKGVGQSSTKAKTQIDKLIAEIDACLEFLSLS